jgi:integrase
VPLHEHVIAQGFLDFVKASGNGPLFYNVAEVETVIDPTNPKKPRHVKTRERVGTWVRDDVGIKDPELSPNHAWRHSFKAVAFRCDMPEKVIDAIVGHTPASVGRGYGAPTLADKARELSKFPRYSQSKAAPAEVN